MTTTVQPITQPVLNSRLSPALIKGTRIYVECPDWCTVDHVDENANHVEDVWHAGDYADLEASRINGRSDLVAFARIGVDPQSNDPDMRNPFVVVDDGGEGFYMTPEQADQFAANLDAFADRIRAMARTAKGGA
jgi:hypothetical protein